MSATTTSDKGVLRIWLIIAAIAALLIGLVAALGGFERREDRWLDASPGEEIDAGNLVFRFDSATAQYLTDSLGSPWRVVVTGSVRNSHEETLNPLIGDYGNLSGIQRDAEPEVAVDWQAGLGPTAPEAISNPRRAVPPTNQWMTLTATFRFDEFEPGDTFQVGVSPMEFTANSILGLSETPVWNTDSYALPTQVTVPLTRLPDAAY